ncbi:hypothetical protein WT14_19390 [Burkholderia stagnalis]|nr:hypothetical protein WT14_19390 [Burkholderia stagnalis]
MARTPRCFVQQIGQWVVVAQSEFPQLRQRVNVMDRVSYVLADGARCYRSPQLALVFESRETTSLLAVRRLDAK